MSLRPGKVDFGRTWAGLSSTITSVLTLKPVPRTEWNDRFADVYSLCVAHPQPLADKLYQELKRLLTKHVVEWRTALSTVKGPDLLNSYHGAWEIYNVAMGYLNLLFRYLNQQHIAKSKSCELPYNNEYASRKDRQLEIGELGMELWKREVILPLEQKLITQLLSGFASAAKGSGVDSAVASTVNSLVAVQQYCIPEEQLDLYQRLFEKRLLEARGDFYKWCAVSLLKDDDVFQYFPAVNSFLQKEMDLASRLLHPTSVPRLRQRCETHLIAEHLPRLQAACCEMVRKEDSKGLSIAYPLLRPIPAGITCLRDELGEQIKQQGLGTCWPQSGTPPTPTEFVDSVLSMLQRYQNLVSIAFQNDSAFTSTLDRAMARVVNHRPAPNTPPPAAELLVRFCNGILCHSKGDMETENELGRAVKVFKYLDDKDVFQKFYARRLARRLIFQQNLSMESEECMINLLKQVCGWEFTSKFHRMFLDISLSIDLCQKFESSHKDKALPGGPAFSVQVLQAGAWPLVSTQLTPFSSPHDLEQHLHSFGSFYRSLHSGRKLTWLYHLFSGEVRLGYLKKPYVVTMQAFQIAILLLFETTDIIPCVKAREMLQLNEDQFYRHAASLVEAKLLILSEAVDIKDTGATLKLNTNFSNKRVKFRLPVVNQRDPPEETKQTLSSVDEDRKMYLQAAIVRIMKSRKILRHTSLVQEVLSQSASASFTPTVNLIKTCIEALIDKQYLERSQHSTDEYSYVA